MKEWKQEAEVRHGPDKVVKKENVVVPVIEVPTTAPIESMVSQGHIQISVEGISVQNGLTSLSQVLLHYLL